MKLTSRKQTALNDTCKLIQTVYMPDKIGNEIPKEEQFEVFCGLFSITQAEHYKAAQIGLRADLGAVISTIDDNGAGQAQVNGKRYKVYRRYIRGDGYTELYLQETQNDSD